MGSTTCGFLCQHPGCWATRRRQEKGLAKSLPPLKLDEDSSDDELGLPTQSICNILEDYGESPMDRYPMSTGGRPSHDVSGSSVLGARLSAHSLDSGLRLGAPHNTTASVLSKQPQPAPPRRPPKKNPRLRLVEVQEVFDRDDLQAGWDETFVTKQYYVWMPNPSKRTGQHFPVGYTHETGVSTAQTNPVLMKDMTECMIPFEIEQKREETVLKKQPRTKSPPKITQSSQPAVLDGTIDMRWVSQKLINELLALPKETLMKVLEPTKKSDFTSPGRLHSIVQQLAQDDERARLALGARHAFQHKELQAPDKRIGRHQVIKGGYLDSPSYPQPVYQLDTNADEDHGIIDRLSSVNTPQRGRRPLPPPPAPTAAALIADRPESEADSVENFPRYSKPLPGIKAGHHPTPAVTTQRVLHYRGKIPSVSLGLPELPSGLRTTRAFNYKRQDLDFSLGPVVTPPSSYRSSEGAAFSEHGTTLKVHVSSTVPGMHDYREDDRMAIHSVSPALSTHVPVPPAGTPATAAIGTSPTKSAPAAPMGYQQYNWDTTRVTISWSQNAQPPSRGEAGGDSAQVTRMLVTPQGEDSRLELDTPEERALGTINETARENQAAGPTVDVTTAKAAPEGDINQNKTATAQPEQEVSGDKVTLKPPGLHLETSTLKRIGPDETPRVKSAKSIESCPSPEQWPLISESSFDHARPTVSEPALSARSDRRRPNSRDSRRDVAARKAMDDNKMKTESPAPPPPSPEPKDHLGESRMRKDLRSRDSLTMAPLFEVAEMDEGSPARTPRTGEQDYGSRKVGHIHSKKIEVTVPAEHPAVSGKEKIKGNNQGDEEGEEDGDKGEIGGEMISQMTVMHVIPKGRVGPHIRQPRELERVQETFLNVDIPAEDVSSLKAEHGSSHQEEVSSSSGVGAHVSAVGSDMTISPRVTVGQSSRRVADNQNVNEEESDNNANLNDTILNQSELEESGLGGHDGQEVVPATFRDGKSEVEDENVLRDESVAVTNDSPELLCDSARFVSHDQVSPIEGENNDVELGASPRFVMGQLVGLDDTGRDKDVENGETGSQQGNLTRRLDDGSMFLKHFDQEHGEDQGETVGIEDLPEEKSQTQEEPPPGVFFFQSSSSEASSEAVTTTKTFAEQMQSLHDKNYDTNINGDENESGGVGTEDDAPDVSKGESGDVNKEVVQTGNIDEDQSQTENVDAEKTGELPIESIKKGESSISLAAGGDGETGQIQENEGDTGKSGLDGEAKLDISTSIAADGVVEETEDCRKVEIEGKQADSMGQKPTEISGSLETEQSAISKSKEEKEQSDAVNPDSSQKEQSDVVNPDSSQKEQSDVVNPDSSQKEQSDVVNPDSSQKEQSDVVNPDSSQKEQSDVVNPDSSQKEQSDVVNPDSSQKEQSDVVNPDSSQKEQSDVVNPDSSQKEQSDVVNPDSSQKEQSDVVNPDSSQKEQSGDITLSKSENGVDANPSSTDTGLGADVKSGNQTEGDVETGEARHHPEGLVS